MQLQDDKKKSFENTAKEIIITLFKQENIILYEELIQYNQEIHK